MKKKNICLLIIALFLGMIFCNNTVVSASEVYGYASMDNGVETINSIEIYDSGKVTLKYKYGLRKAVLYYCLKGEECDSGNYLTKNIMESSADNSYKNTNGELATFNYTINLDKGKEYGIVVQAYFSASSYYNGTENVNSWPIRTLVADTEDKYIKITSGSAKNARMNELMEDIKEIVNTLVIPIIYIVTSLVFIVKGAILGVQIVKSADNPDLRREKIGALKWLVIGVAITYSATSLVGVVSGFFKNAFNL